MPSLTLRKSLLALAISASLPSIAVAAPAPADYACPNTGSTCSVGGLYNVVAVESGTSLSSGVGGAGLFASGSTITTLNNSGSISGGGNGYGLFASRSTITTLNNSGSISVGDNDRGLFASGSTITTLNNSGSISGGDNGYGLFASGSTITTLNNSGSISSGGFGIFLTNLAGAATINQNAGSISGFTAINASNAMQDVTLNWNGGTITGWLNGLKTLNLNLDHASLNGDLTMPAGSTIRMRLTADTSTPVLDLTGNFNLGNGSTIRLSPSTNNFSVDNQTYTLLLGNGEGYAPGLNVVSDSTYLTVHGAPDVNLSTIKATVSIASAAQASSNIAQSGGSPNAQRAGGAITPLLSAMASSNPNDPVLEALTGSNSVRASEQLVPDVNGAALQAANALNYQADLNAGQRTQGLRGASAGDSFVERGLWLKALNSNAQQDERDGIAGFDANSNGLAIGADGKLNDQLTLGIAYSYLNSDIDSDNGNDTEIDGHAITLYSGYEQDAWFLDSSLTLGLNHNDSKRTIAGTTAKGDYDSQMFGLNVLGGYGFQLDNNVLLEPRVAARYGRVDIDSYREKGSIAALDVGSQRYEVAELGAGLRIAGSLPMGQGTLQPEAKVMAYHDFAADQVSADASFVFGGSNFIANGATPTRTRYEAGVGVEYKLAAVTLGVSYDYTGKEDFNADTFQAKVRYDF
ncbi:autotransporter domain-containing protein [Pseudomonas sp. TMP25]|uniref:autotransporter family protein n=1 Tax=Pseudomonas sp. TMP25 TaxID=3136561 RepID=UPI0031014ACB